MIGCQHHRIDGELSLERVEVLDAPAGVPVRYAAYLAVDCLDCGQAFQFLGVPGGVGACPHEPTVNETATELRVPVAPASDLDVDSDLLCPVHGSRS